ncbi:bidirectional sugar transporter SWEET9 isoform X2 [Aplysia californica]|uniref:Sugar transporter SWEET1 n=1 Tax=Aplysia californica TaxID=6500 RepID=A0ABM0JQX3_APLCA|nr:bidirectional sugar transporter SWEET9 isoform X2 [Aplysia californica]
MGDCCCHFCDDRIRITHMYQYVQAKKHKKCALPPFPDISLCTLPLVKLMSVVLLYWGHLLYLESVPKKDVISTLGVFLIVWCVVAYLIPALDILTMVREKSAASCDLSLLLGGTLSASVWYLYGVLVEDVNIYLPCIIGLVVSGIKFFLMLLYRSGPKKSTTTEFSKVRGGDKATEFHEEVYRVSSRDGLRQRM